jgi:hypothetical protein
MQKSDEERARDEQFDCRTENQFVRLNGRIEAIMKRNKVCLDEQGRDELRKGTEADETVPGASRSSARRVILTDLPLCNFHAFPVVHLFTC